MARRKAKPRKRTSKEQAPKRPVTMAKKEPEKTQIMPNKQGPIMKLSKAKDLFKYGVISGATIIPKPMSDGWLLLLIINMEGPKPLETDRGEEREFKSIDTAFRAAQSIGFEEVKIRRKKANLHQI